MKWTNKEPSWFVCALLGIGLFLFLVFYGYAIFEVLTRSAS